MSSAWVPGVQQLGQIFNCCTAATGIPRHTASKYSSEICKALDNPVSDLELRRVVNPFSILPTLCK
jgi:hypothetical protein